MVSDTAIAKTEAATSTRSHGWWLWRREGRQHKRLSPLMLRILAVNVMALAILVGSLLYLGRYQDRLIAAELDALSVQARLSASALGEGAVVVDEEERNILSPLLARMMIRRLVEATDIRTRLFDLDDTLLADSRILLEQGGKIQVEELQGSEDGARWVTDKAMGVFDLVDYFIERQHYPLYQEEQIQSGEQYDIVHAAKSGENSSKVWRMKKGGLLLAVAVPVQRYKQVLGVVMLSRPDNKIDAAIREVRVNILEIFGITLCITVLLSIYLARVIARPLRLLAMAAEGMRHGQMKIVGLAGTASLLNRDTIPDMSDRRDEIGDLSAALRDMTSALAQRVSAIENFAADVAHEIKNPLTSLRSAVETVERVQDPKMQQKLMLIIRDDVDRLDRLITDISSASRLDAELSRSTGVNIDVGHMMATLVDFYSVSPDTIDGDGSPRVVFSQLSEEPVMVMGVEARLVQVLQNLIDNALSFSPPEGHVRITLARHGKFARLQIEDDGPGIPENKLETIFDRFYSERPKTEKFGTHSGLGLSISKQIIEAHRGKVWAQNRKNDKGDIIGALFSIELPLSA